MPVVSAAGQHAPDPALGRAPPGTSDQPRAPGWRAAGVPRIDGAGRTAEVPEDSFNERRLLDAGDDAQPAAALPEGLEVDGEDALEPLRPGEGPLASGGRWRPALAGVVGRGGAMKSFACAISRPGAPMPCAPALPRQGERRTQSG